MRSVLPFFLCLGGLMLLMGCSTSPQNPREVLQAMLESMDRHHSFTYDVMLSSWMPGETQKDGQSYLRHTIEVTDDQEPYIGARYVQMVDDRFFFGYDGQKRMRDTQDPEAFELDSLFKGITEYRVVSRPFFSMARAIADYTLTTTDSISLEMDETDALYQVKVSIFTQDQVDLCMGSLSPYVKAAPEVGFFPDPPHVYILHIDKRTLMPVRHYRLLSHDSSMGEVRDVTYDQVDLRDFDLYDYLPQGFSVFQSGKEEKASGQKLHIGDPAPDFELSDTDGNVHRLSQYRGRRVLIEFTSIACGVCQIVPSFLHQLSLEFPDLQILSVETWNMKPSSCKAWVQRKGVTHPYLVDGKDVLPAFSDDDAVPSFFILDEQGKVVLSQVGYDEHATGDVIRACLGRMPVR